MSVAHSFVGLLSDSLTEGGPAAATHRSSRASLPPTDRAQAPRAQLHSHRKALYRVVLSPKHRILQKPPAARPTETETAT